MASTSAKEKEAQIFLSNVEYDVLAASKPSLDQLWRLYDEVNVVGEQLGDIGVREDRPMDTFEVFGEGFDTFGRAIGHAKSVIRKHIEDRVRCGRNPSKTKNATVNVRSLVAKAMK